MGVGQWPGEALAAAVTGLATVGLAIGRFIYKQLHLSSGERLQIHERGWERASELEKEVILLRAALTRADRGRNLSATISEILMLAMPFELEQRIQAVKHAREIAEASLKGTEPGK